MNNNKDDKNKRGGDSFDRRPIVDPPEAKKQDAVLSAKRKGFYIILLLGITAIGIYAVLSSIFPSGDNDKRIETGAAYQTPAPYAAAVPANANAYPTNDDDAKMPTAKPATPAPTAAAKAESGANAETAAEAEPSAALAQPPVSGKIIKDYSDNDLVYSETMKDWRTHTGIDIGANPDTPVTAIKDGTLKKVYEDSLLGTTVVIHHSDDGTDSVYSNLKDVTDLPIGADVKTGDVLGKVGTGAASEQSDEPHLHFEIRRDDKPVDPKEFVRLEEADYVTPEPSGGPSGASVSASSEPDYSETSSVAYSPDPYTDGEDIETMIID